MVPQPRDAGGIRRRTPVSGDHAVDDAFFHLFAEHWLATIHQADSTFGVVGIVIPSVLHVHGNATFPRQFKGNLSI